MPTGILRVVLATATNYKDDASYRIFEFHLSLGIQKLTLYGLDVFL